MKTLKLTLFLLMLVAPLGAITPMDYYNSLVAGQDDPGFQDGAFDDAKFNQPVGMVFDDTGKRLFVADLTNHRIRVVYLEENDRVDTLAGNGTNGHVDGDMHNAEFASPSVVVYLPHDQLMVYDAGLKCLRLIDIPQKTVTTVATDVDNVWNMVYWAKDNALYISQPIDSQLSRYDLKTQKMTVALKSDPQVPQPRALCVHQDKLFVTDWLTSDVFELEFVPGETSSEKEAVLKAIAKGENITELASTNGQLYALQAAKDPLVTILPTYKPVALATAWGVLLSTQNLGYASLLKVLPDHLSGFTASNAEPGKLFISVPRPESHAIISVKDYHFDSHWAARDPIKHERELSDFDYSTKKPLKTFRILIVGNSRVLTAPTVLQSDDANNKIDLNDRDFHSLRVNTMAKKLEFQLNSEAALNNVPIHFEVLELGRPGKKLQFFINDEVPGIVKKYDIDMVLGLVGPTLEEAYEDYFLKPINGDGIPSNEPDPEFLLKPWKNRIPGGAPERFLKESLKAGFIRADSPKALSFTLFQNILLNGNQAVRDDLTEMVGKPFAVFAKKIASMKTSAGETPSFHLFFVPDPDCSFLERYESFWLDISNRYELSLLDLTKPYQDLKIAYFPVTEACCHQHYTAYGNELIARLLTHYLPLKGWLPFKPAAEIK